MPLANRVDLRISVAERGLGRPRPALEFVAWVTVELQLVIPRSCSGLRPLLDGTVRPESFAVAEISRCLRVALPG